MKIPNDQIADKLAEVINAYVATAAKLVAFATLPSSKGGDGVRLTAEAEKQLQRAEAILSEYPDAPVFAAARPLVEGWRDAHVIAAQAARPPAKPPRGQA